MPVPLSFSVLVPRLALSHPSKYRWSEIQDIPQDPLPSVQHGSWSLLGPVADTRSEEQATGLERFELLGKLEGVDVFDMKAIEMTRLGTLEEPVQIYSLVSLHFDYRGRSQRGIAGRIAGRDCAGIGSTASPVPQAFRIRWR